MERKFALEELYEFARDFNQQWEQIIIQNKLKDWTLAHLKSNIPKTYEIILFGSLGRGDSYPNDIDCFILTHDALITAIKLGSLEIEGYYGISSKLKSYLAIEYLKDFGFETKNWKNLDLHFLPTNFFWDINTSSKYIRAQKDPLFYSKALSCAWIVNIETNILKPITYKTLEQKFA